MLFHKEKVVSNDTTKETNVYERILKLFWMIGKMVLDGVRNPQKFADALQAVVDQATKVYLSVLSLGETIIVKVSDVTEDLSVAFPGGVDLSSAPDNSFPTPAMDIIISELVENGNLTDIFGSLGESRCRWRTLRQVARFCLDHPWQLKKSDFGLFFEIEGGFVAIVHSDNTAHLPQLEILDLDDPERDPLGAGPDCRFAIPGKVRS